MARTIYLQLMLAVLSPVLADIGIKFKRHPQPVAAPVGDEVAFDCMVNVPGDKLTWRWRPVEEARWRDVNGTTDKTSARLAVTVMEDTPTSLYQCVAWYGGVSLVSLPARLSVARVDLTNIRPNTRVMSSPPHNTVVLHCKEPASEPPAVITWWKDNKGSKKPLETPHGVLVLHNVTSDDSGVYGCSATNEPSGRTVDLPERIHLKIQHADSREVKFLESEEYVGTIDNEGVLTVSVKPREVLRLWCGVVGSPPPRVSWSRERTGQLGRHGHLLTIDPFSQEDEDVYSCSANGVRRSWKVIALQAPYWEGTARTSANASEGGEVRVACGVPHGQPSPSVYWLLNSEPVYSSKRNSTVDTELFIRPVEKRHAGVVQCFACNALGCAYDAAMLTVLPLQISEDMDYSGEGPKSAHGALQAPKRHSRKNPRKHKAVMVPPSRPNVTRLSDTSVMVSWSQPNHGLSVTFFKVQYKEVSNVSDSSWQTGNWDIQPHIHACEVDTLHPAYYKFRIAAVYSNQDNKQGRSSGRFLLQRRVAQVPRAPDLTLAKALSSKTIQLNWTWSAGDGVQAEGFYIYYRALSSAGLYDKVAVPGGHIRGHVVLYLHPDTAYEAKVRSYTTQAASDFSSIKQAKTHRQANATSTTTEPPVEDMKGSARAPDPLVTAGGALGAVALLVLLAVTLLLCRRAKRPPADKEKGTVPEGGGGNGYIQAKVPITITANPMHAEGGDGGVEMSFLHNNNCGNTGNNDDTLPHSRKNGPGNRQYV